MNVFDFIILILLFLLLANAVRIMRKNKKEGKSSCGCSLCSGDCSACHTASHCTECKKD